jgi:hypothetical protein
MSIVNVLRLIRQMGLTASYNNGEYRIDFKKDDPRRTAETSYFTTDQTDAFATARFMAAMEKK